MDYLAYTVLILLCLIYLYFRKKLNYFKDLDVPYVPAAWPILGNMVACTFRRQHLIDIIKYIYNYNQEAKYIGAFNYNTPVIVLRDPEIIKDITIKHFDKFPDHPHFIDETVDPLFGLNLFAMTGEKWKEARSLLTPAFTARKMKIMFDLMIECSEKLLDHIAKLTEDSKNIISTRDLFMRYTNDVITTSVFGLKIDSFKEPENDFYMMGKEAADFEGFMGVKFFLSRNFPEILKILRISVISDKVRRFFTSVVKSIIKMREEKGLNRPDIIQLMMDARGKNHLLKLDTTEITGQAFLFFLRGFHTTSTEMCLIAHELALNQKIQEKLQAEINGVLEHCNGRPTYEAINSMPYFDAVFNETLRRRSQFNIIHRLCTKPFELPEALPGGKPMTVRPGTIVWIPVAAIHHDEQYFENPEKFMPERYLDKKVSANGLDNLGFGMGPRSCIGSRFAILQTKIMFFYLLSCFTLKPNEKNEKKGVFWLYIERKQGKNDLFTLLTKNKEN